MRWEGGWEWGREGSSQGCFRGWERDGGMGGGAGLCFTLGPFKYKSRVSPQSDPLGKRALPSTRVLAQCLVPRLSGDSHTVGRKAWKLEAMLMETMGQNQLKNGTAFALSPGLELQTHNLTSGVTVTQPLENHV